MHADVHDVLVTGIKAQQILLHVRSNVCYSAMGFGRSECLVEKGNNLLVALSRFESCSLQVSQNQALGTTALGVSFLLVLECCGRFSGVCVKLGTAH